VNLEDREGKGKQFLLIKRQDMLNVLCSMFLLPNTDRLQQVKNYVRGCTTSTKYWPPSASWRLCQMLYCFYQITDHLQQVEDYVKCTMFHVSSTKYCPPSTSWRLCQMFTIDVPPSSLNLVLRWLLFYLFCSSIVINTAIVTVGTFEP